MIVLCIIKSKLEPNWVVNGIYTWAKNHNDIYLYLKFELDESVFNFLVVEKWLEGRDGRAFGVRRTEWVLLKCQQFELRLKLCVVFI